MAAAAIRSVAAPKLFDHLAGAGGADHPGQLIDGAHAEVRNRLRLNHEPVNCGHKGLLGKRAQGLWIVPPLIEAALIHDVAREGGGGAGGRQRLLHPRPPPFQAGRLGGHRQVGEVGQVAEEARPGVRQAGAGSPAVLPAPAARLCSAPPGHHTAEPLVQVRVKLPEIGR